jgi:hypothetical protein
VAKYFILSGLNINADDADNAPDHHARIPAVTPP